nr:MAG: RNA-dependent RNA polymerase [Culex Bunyavirus 2]
MSAFSSQTPQSAPSFASGLNIPTNLPATIDGVCLTSLALLNNPEAVFQEQDIPHIIPFVKHYTLDPEWFSVTKNVERDLWEWSINVPDLTTMESIGPAVSMGGMRTDKAMRTLRHDIVAAALSDSKTDVRLDTVFPNLAGMREGALTPDFYVQKGGAKFFVELGTTKATDPSSGAMDMRKKLFKYTEPLKAQKFDGPCLLIALIVSPRYVVSNYVIDPLIVEKLIYHLCLALALEQRIAGLNLPNLMQPADTHEEIIMSRIKDQLELVEVEDYPNENLNITRPFIESLSIPADYTKVSRYFCREVNKATQEITNRNAKILASSEDPRYMSLLEALRTKESKSYVKPVTPMPLFVVPRHSEVDMTVRAFTICDPDGGLPPTLELWSKAMQGYMNLHVDFCEDLEERRRELYYTKDQDQKRVEERLAANRSRAHRCSLTESISPEALRQLAMDGVWGKKFKNDKEKLDKERLQSLPFHYDTSVADITDFLNNTELYAEYEYAEEDTTALDLIDKCFRDMDLKPEAMVTATGITRTKFFCALEICSAIALELTISLKQHTKKNDVLIKKLAHYEIYLLIVPTKASEHIFFSIWVPGQEGVEVLSDLPFRSFKPAYGDAMYTDFCSFRQDKLSNHATSSCTLMGLIAYFSYHYHLPSCKPSALRKSRDAMMMINYTMLVRLENKLPTEEAISISRYMFMEVLKGAAVNRPDPFRLLCKISPVIRSRLQLFSVRRLLHAFSIMVDNPVRRLDPEDKSLTDAGDDDVPSNDRWTGLINPITLSEEPSAAEVISSFYIGYAVDKDQIAQENTDFKIIQKAIKKDLEFDVTETHKSSGIWDEFEDTPKEKQFSVNAIKVGVEIMRRVLLQRYGAEYQVVIEQLVLKALANHMTDSLATLKASAKIDHVPWNELPQADNDIKTRSGRLKVIEALVKELHIFGYNPYMSLAEIVQIIEQTSHGVISDLFKKNQHAGLREIYVLTIKSRLLALLVETYSRTLCKEFDCEAMTHPDQKLEVVERHKSMVKRIMHATGRKASEYQCSADKKSWNNNLVMPALSIPLLMLLPKKMHGTVQRVLNLWNERLVKLPHGVMKLLVAGVELSDPTYKTLMEEFEDPGCYNGQPLLPGPGSAFCILRRGMMQGILHYTSSLLHVAYLHLTSAMIRVYFKTRLPATSCIINQMCSSDDSATIFSILHSKTSTPEEDEKIVVHSELVCQALTTFCNYTCFTNSEKSTMGSHNHLEFNSEFIIGNTLAVPTLKWVFACYQVSESENLLLRQQTMYNLMSQLSSAGLPSYNTTIVQISQGLLHYKLLGSDTNQFFDVFYREITNYPDPSLGFFLMDQPLTMGVNGFSYHHWLHCKMNNMFQVKKKSVLDGSIGFNPEGGIMESFLVRHGDSRRYKELVERISGGEIWELREKVNSEPLILYSPTQSTDEARIKIYAKALAPGTAQSLSRGVPFIQAVAVSIYGLQNYCYTRSDASYDSGKGEKTYSKISLIGEIARRRREKEPASLVHDMTWESVCFPNYRRYQDILIVISKFKHAREVRVGPIRHKKSRLTFQQATSVIGVPLYDLVKEKWAGHHLKQSVQLKTRAWECYKALMPWLKDTIDETLEASPFLDHVELHNFVSTQAKRARTYVKVGPAIRSSYPIAQMEQLCRKTYKDRVLLVLPEQRDQKDGINHFRDRRTSVGLALEIPVDDFRDTWVKVAARQCPVQQGELTNLKDKGRREATLAIITAALNNHPHEEIQRAVEELGSGLFLSWRTPQEMVEVHKPVYKKMWVGPGELVLSNKNVYCLAKLMDGIVTQIQTNSIVQLRKVQHQILAAFKEQNLKPDSCMGGVRAINFLTCKGLDLTGPGTPILEMVNNPMFQPPDNLAMRFSVQITQGCLKLMQTGTTLPATLLTYKTLPVEFEPSLDGRIFTDVWRAWYHQSQLDAEVAEDFIVQTVRKRRSEKDDDCRESGQELQGSTKLIVFIRKTLMARLRHLGYLQLSYKPTAEETTMLSEEEDPEIVKAMQDALQQCMYDVINTEDVGDLEVIGQCDADLDRTAVHLNWADEAEEGMMCSEVADFFAEHAIKGAPVEFVTSRLSTRYGIMQFWDSLIHRVNSVNQTAWGDLASGRNVAGLVNSSAFVWLFTNSKGDPPRTFGKSVGESVNEEAMIAIYAKKSSRSTASTTSRIQARYSDTFMRMTKALISESEKLKGKDEIVKEIMDLLSQAKVKADEAVEAEGSISSSSSDSLVSVGTMSPITKVQEWVLPNSELGPGPDYIPPAGEAMMEGDELNWLFAMIKDKLNLADECVESATVLCHYLKGELEIPAGRVFDIEEKMVYFCHLGSIHSGHWTAFVTGVRLDGVVEYYDSLLDHNSLVESKAQLQNLFPNDDIRVEMINVQRQGLNSCGHHAVFLSCYRMFGWQLPSVYTDRDVRRWITTCIQTRRIEPMAIMYQF